MATSTSGINVGDAVLSFLADTTDLDAAIARINAEVPAKLKGSGDAVVGLGASFEQAGQSAATAAPKLKAAGDQGAAAGKSIADAGKQAGTAFQPAGPAVDQLTARIKQLEAESIRLQQQLAEVTKRFQDMGQRAGSAGKEAAAEVGLLGEATGVTLPRHVRTFVGALPGISAALSAAFSATAIFFVIEALVKASEKIEEFIEKPRKIEEAWRAVGDSFAKVDIEVGAALDSAGAKIVGLVQGPVAQLDFELKHIANDGRAAAAAVGAIGDAVTKALVEDQGSKWNPLSWWNDNSRDVAKQASQFFGQLQSDLTQPDNQGGLETLQSELQNVNRELAEAAKQAAASTGPVRADIYKDRIAALQQYRAALTETASELQKFGSEDQAQKATLELSRAQAAYTQSTDQARRALDSQLGSISAVTASQKIAFDLGRTSAADWAVAQERAATQATGAQLAYQNALRGSQGQFQAQIAQIAQAFPNIAAVQEAARNLSATVQAQSVAQQTATEKTKLQTASLDQLAEAMRRHNQAAAQVLKDWSDLQEKNVAKSFNEAQQAAQRLVQEELKLADAQQKLRQAALSATFTAQEQAVERLANLGIIGEEQKAARLKELYGLEEKDALGALNDLLAKEQEAAAAARAKLSQGKQSGILDDAQLARLEANLDMAETAYDRTFTEILATHQKFASKYNQMDDTLIRHATSSWNGFFRALASGSLSSSHAIDAGFALITGALQNSIAAAVEGQQTFGQAMASMAASALGSIAAEAIVQAIYYTALGFARIAEYDYAAAASAFEGAALFGSIGAAAAAAGSALAGGSRGSSSGGNGSSAATATEASPAQAPGQQPVQAVNVQHLAGGGVTDKKRLVMIGDSPSGGDAPEAVIPLDNRAALARIGQAIVGGLLSPGAVQAANRSYSRAEASQASATATQASVSQDALREMVHAAVRQSESQREPATVNHITEVNVGGMISPDNLNKTMREVTRGVKRGKIRMTTSNSFRLTKRG